MTAPKFAIWESAPVIYSDREAWAMFDGEHWVEIDTADVWHKASMISPELFRQIFPHVPPLPLNQL